MARLGLPLGPNRCTGFLDRSLEGLGLLRASLQANVPEASDRPGKALPVRALCPLSPLISLGSWERSCRVSRGQTSEQRARGNCGLTAFIPTTGNESVAPCNPLSTALRNMAPAGRKSIVSRFVTVATPRFRTRRSSHATKKVLPPAFWVRCKMFLRSSEPNRS